MAWFDHTDVKKFCAELLLTSAILDTTIDELYIPMMVQEVYDIIDPIYVTPLQYADSLIVVPDDQIPSQIKNAALYKTIEVTIVNNYADKSSNQEALGVAKFYGSKAQSIITNIQNGKLFFTNLLQRKVQETEFSFLIGENAAEADIMDQRVSCFLDTLNKRFY